MRLERFASTALLALVPGFAAVGCAHRERETQNEAPVNAPVRDVAAALARCPPSFPGLSVRTVQSEDWPRSVCFGVRGRLIATFAQGEVCNLAPIKSGEPEPHADGLAKRCPLGWVLTDPADPVLALRDGFNRDDEPGIRLADAGPKQIYLRPLEGCLQDEAGKPVMPARTRFRLPRFDVADVARLNATLAGLTIGVFGGMQLDGGRPTYFEPIRTMVATHVCRIDAASDDGAHADGG